MARENRRENRRAAKEILEGENTQALSKEARDAANKEQLEFFDTNADESMLDIGNDDDEEQDLSSAENDDNENDGEVEGENKPSPAPNVESKGVEEVAKTGEADEEEEQELDEGLEAKPAAAETAPTPKVEEPAKPAETAGATGATGPAPEVKKEVEAAAEAKPAAETKPSVLSNEEAAKLYGEWRDQTEGLLASHHYRLDEKQVAELNENPAAIIPKLMSKVYMDSISAAFQQITQYLPRMVGQVLEQRNSMNAAEQAFFSKWPALVDKRDTVIRLGAAYRSSNPTASMDDFINEVGAQAMVALRLMPAGQATPDKPAEKKPFKPAAATPAPSSAPAKSTNPFENLMAEFGEDVSEEDMD